jgi:hypothetical protein
MRDLYVQYGCGFTAPPGWLSFDASPTLRFERLPIIGKLYTKNGHRFPDAVRYGDIVKGLPLPPESCKAIFCSHVLEHLSREDFDQALRNTRALLQPGGTFRLVLPDLEQFAKRYLENKSALASSEFMEATSLGKVSRPRTLKRLLSDWLGGSAHLWMWDARSIEHKLAEHGFRSIRRVHFGEWDDPAFGVVEEKSRFVESVGMQCVK